MNYRHAYHAGNHTEVFKHSVLCLLLLELRKKPKPFAVLDTHAGAGNYDLSSNEAAKTGEAREGMDRVARKIASMAGVGITKITSGLLATNAAAAASSSAGFGASR